MIISTSVFIGLNCKAPASICAINNALTSHSTAGLESNTARELHPFLW